MFFLKQIFVIASYSVAMILEGPVDFSRKVKLKIIRITGFKFSGRDGSNKTIIYEEPRNYRLPGKIKASRNIEYDEDPCVFVYLTNSYPYSRAGYAERSHKMLFALAGHGLSVKAATRFAYPNVIGDIARRETDSFGNYDVHRVLPSHFPQRRLKQFEKAINEVEKLCRRLDVSILHTTSDFNNAYIISHVADRLGIPWTYETRGEAHNTWLSKVPSEYKEKALESDYYKYAVEQELDAARSAATCVVLSKLTRNSLISKGVDPDKIVIVPNSIDPREIEPLGQAENLGFQKPENKILIGTVSSIVSYEGIDLLIKALKDLPLSIEALIVGDGEERKHLENLAETSGLKSRVHFVGSQPQSHISQWYDLLDVFVIPRTDDIVCRNVTPIKGLLAQGLGIPVVSSDLEALREVTGDKASYFQPGNSDDLAKAILDTIESNLTPVKAKEAQRFVLQRTWSRSTEPLIKVFRGI